MPLTSRPLRVSDRQILEEAAAGDCDRITYWLNLGADIESTDARRMTPLMYAASKGHVDAVALLLSRGANVNVGVNSREITALQMAVENGHVEVAKILIAHGADIHAVALFERYSQPATILMHACSSPHNVEIVKILLEKGAHPGLQLSPDTMTALMIAVDCNLPAIIGALLANQTAEQKRQLITQSTFSGKSALSIAKDKGLSHIVMHLFFPYVVSFSIDLENHNARLVTPHFRHMIRSHSNTHYLSQQPTQSFEHAARRSLEYTSVENQRASYRSTMLDSIIQLAYRATTQKQEKKKKKIPKHFLCPITMAIMNDPTFCTLDGRTYEYWAIFQALEISKVAPFNRKPLGDKEIQDVLFENFSIKSEMAAFKQKHPHLFDEKPVANSCKRKR